MITGVVKPTEVSFFQDMQWQVVWKRNWRKPGSWYSFYPRNEDGPAELYFGVWIFQFHKYLYE